MRPRGYACATGARHSPFRQQVTSAAQIQRNPLETTRIRDTCRYVAFSRCAAWLTQKRPVVVAGRFVSTSWGSLVRAQYRPSRESSADAGLLLSLQTTCKGVARKWQESRL